MELGRTGEKTESRNVPCRHTREQISCLLRTQNCGYLSCFGDFRNVLYIKRFWIPFFPDGHNFTMNDSRKRVPYSGGIHYTLPMCTRVYLSIHGRQTVVFTQTNGYCRGHRAVSTCRLTTAVAHGKHSKNPERANPQSEQTPYTLKVDMEVFALTYKLLSLCFLIIYIGRNLLFEGLARFYSRFFQLTDKVFHNR